jgi:hypothetical protein
LKAAITKNSPEHLIVRLGHAVIRVACGAHTGQLAVADLVRDDDVIGTFVGSVKDLVSWISAREKDFAKHCPCKLPQFIATRWNTLCQVTKFLIEHKEDIAAFVCPTVDQEQAQYQKGLLSFQAGRTRSSPVAPIFPPLLEIPDF